MIFESIQHAIKLRADTILNDVYSWAQISSHSEDIKGLDYLAGTLYKNFQPIAEKSERIKLQPFNKFELTGETSRQQVGDLLVFTCRPTAPLQILITGHYDTVFTKADFCSVTKNSAEYLCGPGVTDMKGGIAVIHAALAVLEKRNAIENIGWQILLNPDEEIGSPVSSKHFEKYIKSKHIGFTFEPSLDMHGTFAANRKASGVFSLVIKGKAAHAGREFHLGKSSIACMGAIIEKIHVLNNKYKNSTVNIGLVQGGSAVNVVPENCVIKLLLRAPSMQEAKIIENKIKQIISLTCEQYTTEFQIQGNIHRPAKILTQEDHKLFEFVANCAQQLDINFATKDTGGVCDGNNLHMLGLPVIDTMGVIGSGIHSAQERLYIPSLQERALLFAKCLYELNQENNLGFNNV